MTKYEIFILNIENFEKTFHTFLNVYQKSNLFLKKKVIYQNSSWTVLTPAIIWELFAKKSADRPNCHYSSVTFSMNNQFSTNLKVIFSQMIVVLQNKREQKLKLFNGLTRCINMKWFFWKARNDTNIKAPVTLRLIWKYEANFSRSNGFRVMIIFLQYIGHFSLL